MNMKNFGIIEGRLTHKPDLRTNEAGNSSLFLSIAVNRNFKNKDGNYDTDFINVSAFGNTAEFIAKHFDKGSAIKVQHSVRSRTREVEIDGKKVNRTELILVAESAEFAILGKATAKSTDSASADTAAAPASDTDFAEIAADDDDLPF